MTKDNDLMISVFMNVTNAEETLGISNEEK